jgi:F-type H+-transporting ATPase subunit delta
MTSRTAASRYARALFDVALKEAQDLAGVERELAAFLALLKEHQTLEKVLLNPAVPAPRKRAAVATLVGHLTVSPIVGKLLVLLAERDRLGLLGELAAAYHDRLLDHQNVVRAEVTTAHPLTTDRAQAIERSLVQATGRKIVMAARVDPSIIGGLVARVGSTVYDGSVTAQLARMKQKLMESV